MVTTESPGAKALRAACVAGGAVCVGLAALGLFLPLLPTTPFLLLAAALFFRGSRRMYVWLLDNPKFGGLIRQYRAGHGIPRRAKRLAIALLWLTIGASVMWVVSAFPVRLALIAVAVSVTVFLLRLPSRSPVPGGVARGQASN